MFSFRTDRLSLQILQRVALLSLLALFGVIFAVGEGLVIAIQSLQTDLNDKSLQAARTIDQTLGSLDSDLIAVGRSFAAGAEPAELLRLTMDRHPSLLELFMVDVTGNRVASRSRSGSGPGAAVSNQPWMATVFFGGIYHSLVDYEEFGVPSIAVAVPVPDPEGRFVGSLVAKVDLTSLGSQVASLVVGRDGYVYVTDKTGQVLVHRNAQVIEQATSITEELDVWPQELSQTGFHFYRGLERQWVVGSGTALWGLPWYAIVEQPAVEVLRPLAYISAGYFVIIVLLALVIFNIIRFTQSRIVRPLNRLREKVAVLAQGNLDERIDLRSQDELGQLAAAFNSMATELQSTIQALRGSRDELEVRVQERTAALSQANDLLQAQIQERMRAQAELDRRAQELVRSNAELEQFAYVASHDLREPLRKVQGFGDRLLAKYASVLDERGRDYLQRMRNASARMETLIDDLLTYSRVTTKAQPFVPVDLGTVVREVLLDLESRLEQTGGRVEVADLPSLQADPLQMRQLFQNLIGNALKFHKAEMPPMVRITSRLPAPQDRLWVGELVDTRLLISVEDNGIGFDEKYVDRIFAMFERLHGRAEYDGTGIGLAIARKIVERHGGRITAQSQPDVGTTFLVALPRHPQGAPIS